MRFPTFFPSACFGLRCMTQTSCPALTSSATSCLPINRVPPITRIRSLPVPGSRLPTTCSLIVVFKAEMGDEFFTPHPAQRVLQFHELDEEVMLGIQTRRSHRRLEIERKPFLDAAHAGALRKIEEQDQIEHQRGGEERIPAQKVDLDLHWIAEPT